MSNKLFERITDYKVFDEDVRLEDPNQLGATPPPSMDLVQHLNYLAEQADDIFSRRSNLDLLVTHIQFAEERYGLSYTSASMIAVAVECLLKGTGIEQRAIATEAFLSGNNRIETAYAVENLWSTIKELDEVYRDKIGKLINKAQDFHKNVLKKSGRVENAAKSLLEKLDKLDGHPASPRVSIKGKYATLIVPRNTAGAVHSMASMIKAGHFADGAGRAYNDLLGTLKGHTLKDKAGFIDFAKACPDNAVDEVVSTLQSNGFTLINEESKEDKETKNGLIVLHSKHGLIGQVFLAIMLQHVGHKFISGTNMSYGVRNADDLEKEKELPALSIKELRECLEAVIETAQALNKYEDDHNVVEETMGGVSKEITRLFNEFGDLSKDLKGTPDHEKIQNYLFSLWNTLWLLAGPASYAAANAMDICDAVLDYCNESYKNLDSHSIPGID